MRIKNIAALIISISLPFLAGLIGSIATYPSIPTWYAGLNKPFFNPPNWIFGPVWTMLYIFMGIAAFFVWQKRKENKDVIFALAIFALQLALNSSWSIVFFGMHQIFWAYLIIIALWAAILFCWGEFYLISKPAGWLFVPYVLWVSFATVLNGSIWMLNK